MLSVRQGMVVQQCPRDADKAAGRQVPGSDPIVPAALGATRAQPACIVARCIACFLLLLPPGSILTCLKLPTLPGRQTCGSCKSWQPDQRARRLVDATVQGTATALGQQPTHQQQRGHSCNKRTLHQAQQHPQYPHPPLGALVPLLLLLLAEAGTRGSTRRLVARRLVASGRVEALLPRLLLGLGCGSA